MLPLDLGSEGAHIFCEDNHKSVCVPEQFRMRCLSVGKGRSGLKVPNFEKHCAKMWLNVAAHLLCQKHPIQDLVTF
jgi:hypothetical protein